MNDLPPRLQMTGVGKRFGPTRALAGVDFAVAAGQVHALVGENGAGKSTLMKILAGALAPDEGAMSLDGQPYRPRNPQAARRAGVAMIYQELALAPHLSVAENILLGMEPTRFGVVRGQQLRRQAAAALAQLGATAIPIAAPVGSLSVAQQQVVEIARAVAIGCRVLVLDEPTSSLGRADIEHLFALINRLRAEGHAIVYISHMLEEVTRIADQVTVLRDGQSVGSAPVAAISTEQIIRWMVGREMDQLYPRTQRHPGEPVLTLNGLGGHHKPVTASLTLHRGEVLGIAGLVGAGRTELLRCVFGLDRVRRGTVTVGLLTGPCSPLGRWAQGIGFVSEDRKSEGLALRLSITDNLTLTKLPLLVWPATQERTARSLIECLAIRCQDGRQEVGALSGGNQQKVALARLLHHQVDVWLLDEPTRGIDVGSKAQIYELIDQAVARGTAVLMVSSYLPELLGVCDRLAVMSQGTLGPAQPVGDWDEHQIMEAATGVLA